MQAMNIDTTSMSRLTTFRFSIHGGSIRNGTADVQANDMDRALRLMSALFPGCEFTRLESQHDEWY
jgi:hypothetical protein